jgi:retinol dehydrogenase-12
MSKICIITGGNSGIGLATACEMAKMGYHLILACRSEERTKPIIEELIKTTGNSNIEFMKLDLSSLKSVREFVSQFKEKNLPLHVLINNAGCQGLYGLTEDGLEIVLASNHFGHFLLTNLLLDKLYETYKQTGEPSRIVIVASDAYKFVDRFDFNDIEGKKIEGKYFGMQTYGRSKLANILFGIELNKRLNSEKFSGILVNMMHPGAVATNVKLYFFIFLAKKKF